MSWKNLLRTTLLLATGALGGVLFARWGDGAGRCGGFRYINHDYACGSYQTISKLPYSRLIPEVEKYLAAQRQQHNLIVGAVYFRDLRGGPAWGIDESVNFAPASLLKLPLVMTYFAMEEESPGVLATGLRIDRAALQEPRLTDQHEKVADDLEDGKTYPAMELARRAVVHSDNVAYLTLVDHMNAKIPGGRDRIIRTFQELGVIDPRNVREEVVTARIYSSLFRLLYNVSFLNAEHSELLLDWLAASVFAKGLSAGLPEGTLVANKFGERDLEGGLQYLHDCGIVYYPGNPYLLCVMTRGRDWDALASIISTVSRMVWTEVDGRHQ